MGSLRDAFQTVGADFYLVLVAEYVVVTGGGCALKVSCYSAMASRLAIRRLHRPATGLFSRRFLATEREQVPVLARPTWSRALVVAGGMAAMFGLGFIYPSSPWRYVPPTPGESDTEAYQREMDQYEAALQRLPLVEKLRKEQDPAEWYETRPYKNIPEGRRRSNLSAGSLRGPGKLASIPLARVKRDESESIVFLHVGKELCGHEGIIHGGLLSTILDESLGRTVRLTFSSEFFRYLIIEFSATQAIMNLPDKIGVTATLTVNFKAPTKAHQVGLWFHCPFFSC
jgi:acyl-coenzyme A thioesterase PaaI-like protein